MTPIRVAHEGADYEVIVGGLAEALPKLAALAAGQPVPVISDQRVFALHGHLLRDVAISPPILVPEGEAAKDWASLSAIIDGLAALGTRRMTPIVALGGGSVGDVAGLAASLFKRGCPIVHLPTTLLAQVDSAIGGKTAIDSRGEKNLVGTFHHPSLVIADPALLDSLDDRQLRSGYAEVVKYGLIDDPDFFAWCEANGRPLIDGNRDARSAAIRHCVRAKTRSVVADPEDRLGRRALLNLGHTFGHAIEALGGPDVLHGEAVAVGMMLAFRFSHLLDMCAAGEVERIGSHLASVGLPTVPAELGMAGRAGELLDLMNRDKKADRSGLALVLVRGIGRAELVRSVDVERLAIFLEDAA